MATHPFKSLCQSKEQIKAQTSFRLHLDMHILEMVLISLLAGSAYRWVVAADVQLRYGKKNVPVQAGRENC